MSESDLSGATLKFVPVIKNLHGQLLEGLEHGGKLEMSDWHTCETTHCRAGWTVVLAGDAGRAMEGLIGTNATAALLIQASCPFLNGKTPDFFASNEAALADIKRCAELEQKEK